MKKAIQITGLDEVQRAFDALGERAEQVFGTVPLADLLTDEFVATHSNFDSVLNLCLACGNDGVHKITDANKLLLGPRTSFGSWDALLAAAKGDYLRRKLTL